jgi:hypothetical protein
MSDPTLKMRLDGFRSCIYDAARRFDIEPDLLRGVVAPIFQALRVPRGAAPATRGAAPPDLVTCEGQPVPHLRSGLCAAPREWRRGDETAPAGPAPVTAPRDDRRCGHGVYQPGCGDCARQLSQRASAPSSPPPSGGALHASDCATHNEPAYPAGPCDCKPRRPRSAREPHADGRRVQLLRCRERRSVWTRPLRPCPAIRIGAAARPRSERDPGGG